MSRKRRFAFLLAVVLAVGVGPGVLAAYYRSGLPGDPPQPLLPAVSSSAPLSPVASEKRSCPIRHRFYHDRDVQVFGVATIVLAGVCSLAWRSRPGRLI